jgi:hypothetical protein
LFHEANLALNLRSSELVQTGLKALALASCQVVAESAKVAVDRFLDQITRSNKAAGDRFFDQISRHDIEPRAEPRAETGSLDSLKLGVDVDNESPILDLAAEAIGSQLIRAIALSIRDHAIELQINQEFQKLQDQISASIRNEEIGYLIEATVYVDDFGTLVIPGGQILYPIGLGIDPLDAMAEHMAHPQVHAQPPQLNRYRDSSFHYWIGKKNGELGARMIRKERTSKLRDAAHAEMLRRSMLNDWARGWPEEPYQSLARAQYWNDIEEAYGRALRDQLAKEQERQLGREMNASQTEFNKLYRAYQDLEREMQRHEEYLAALGKIGVITTIIDGAIKAHALFSPNDKAVKEDNLKAKDSVPRTVEMVERRIETSGSYQRIVEKRLRIEFEKIQDFDERRHKIWIQEGVSLPARKPLSFPIQPR